MGRGFLLVLVGVAGLFANKVLDIKDVAAPYVTGGAIAAIVIGALLFLVEASQEWGLAFWLFLLVAAGVGELIFAWLPDGYHAWVVGIAIGIGATAVLVAIAGGLAFLGEEVGPYAAALAVAAIGLAGLIVFWFVGVGAAWHSPLIVVSTALLTVGLAATPLGTDVDAAIDDVPRLRGLIAGMGTAVAVTALVAVESFDIEGVWWALLALPIVSGFFATGPLAGYAAFKAFAQDQSETAQESAVESGMRIAVSGALGTYSLMLATTLTLWIWLTVLLVIVTVAAYGNAVVSGSALVLRLRLPEPTPTAKKPKKRQRPGVQSVRQAAPAKPAPPPVRPTPLPDDRRRIADRLAHLAAQPDRVYRLLPRNE